MKLFEEGKFRLNDKITEYIPEFQGGKSDITIRNLLTHFSGSEAGRAADHAVDRLRHRHQAGVHRSAGRAARRKVCLQRHQFLLLGELVHRLSGQMLPDYARDHIFGPLGMKTTMFQPPSTLTPRIAPTERTPHTGPPLRGVVHDPTARNMGGIAGHAGLFSTADDLSRFAQMMLNGGELDGVRVLNPLTVQKFTEPQSPPDQPILRGLGWDIDSPLLEQSRRAVPHRLLRAHRFHRYLDLDRPFDEDLRDPAGEQRAPHAASGDPSPARRRWPRSRRRRWGSLCAA